MESLNRTYAQVRDLFITMTPSARITAGLLLIVVVVSLGYLFRQGTAGPDAALFGGERLSRSQLDRIEAAFGKAGLSGYEFDGYRVHVPRGKEADYMAAIFDADAMPADIHRLLPKAISAAGVFGSKDDRKQQVKAAEEHRLSLILSQMTGIKEAYVIIHESRERLSRGPMSKQRVVTASVNVQAESEDSLNPQRVKAIRRSVAKAIGGSQDNISVTDLASGRVFGGGEEAEGDAIEDKYYARRQLIETRMRDKILNEVLADIRGVRVAVSAELDNTIEMVTRDVKVEPTPVTLRTTENSETSTTKDATPGGLVGTQSNTAVANNISTQNATRTAGRSNESSTASEQSTSDAVASHSETRTTKLGLIPTRITATIRIPSSYWKAVWQERNKPDDGSKPPDPTAADIDTIAGTEIKHLEECIVDLLGEEKIPGRDSYAKVNISTYQSFATEKIEGPSLTSTAMAWTGQNWSTLGMMSLAMFGLVMLRSMVKAVPTPKPDGTADTTFHVESEKEDGEGDENNDPDRPRLRLRKGPSLKDDLADMVREDPDAAASILRTWIGNAG